MIVSVLLAVKQRALCCATVCLIPKIKEEARVSTYPLCQVDCQAWTNHTHNYATDIAEKYMQLPSAETQEPQRKPDIGYIPTPQKIVRAMLTLAGVTEDDILYDLGSGDGRVVLAAAQQIGTRGVGIDIDPKRIREANENAQRAEMSDRVEFRQQNLFESDFSEATVVILYLLPHLNLRLRPQLFHYLRPGTRVVSHDFDMGDWKPDQVMQIQTPEESTLYYWVIPEAVPEHLRADMATGL